MLDGGSQEPLGRQLATSLRGRAGVRSLERAGSIGESKSVAGVLKGT